MIGYLGDYPGVFNIEQINLMSKAFNNAWAIAQERIASCDLGEKVKRDRAALAKSIIAAAVAGEFDPWRLSEIARAELVAGIIPLGKSTLGSIEGAVPGLG